MVHTRRSISRRLTWMNMLVSGCALLLAGAAFAAYDLITKQHLPLPKVVVEPPRIVTKANVNTIVNWGQQLANISK